MKMRKTLYSLAAVAALACFPAHAAIDNYVASLYGANEVGVGDPDGFGSALIAIDTFANTVNWSILALNVAFPLTGAHIHQGVAGVNGGVIVNFSGSVTGSGLFDTDLTSITPATASGFYVNLHNTAYPSGAIRGQLSYVSTVSAVPEPETFAMLLAGLGVVGWVGARRRKSAA
jgi:hypothetical protein